MSSIIFKNIDGSKSAYLFNEPVKFYDINGVAQDKDNEIISFTGDYEYKYTNKSNDIKVYFPDQFSENVGVRLKDKNFDIQIIPTISQSTEHSVPLVDKNTITFHNVFDSNIDLKYKALYSGYKEDIILYEYTGMSEFTYTINTNGMYIEEDNGKYYIVAPSTSDKICIGEIFIYDSANSYSKGSIKIESVTKNQEYKMTITADKEFLLSENIKYPVHIDPTITMYYTGNPKKIIDAPLYSGQPNMAAGGSYYNNLGCVNTNYGYSRSIIGFPGLSDLIVTNNLQAQNITQVTYNASCIEKPQSGNTIFAYQFSGNSWNESTVTASNAPISGYSGNIIASMFVNSNTAWATFDITTLAQNWTLNTSNATKGIMLKLETSGELNPIYATRLAATEYGDTSSYLYINYHGYNYTVQIYRDNLVTQATAATAFNNAKDAFNTSYDISFILNSNSQNTNLNMDSSCLAGSNDICTISCGTLTNCNATHHKSAGRLLNLLRPPLGNNNFRIRIVGYKICWYGGSPAIHTQVSGLGDTWGNGRNTIVTTNSYHPNTGSFTLVNLIQHELSHNLGVPDHTCTSGQLCVMNKSEGVWCTKHYNEIKVHHPN